LPREITGDQIRARMDCPATVKAVRELSQKWPQTHTKLIEDKANGSAVIQMLQYEIAGVLPVNPEGGKVARGRRQSASRSWQPSICPTQTTSDFGQGDALRIGQSQPGGQLGSEDPVFRRQVLVLQKQFLIDGSVHVRQQPQPFAVPRRLPILPTSRRFEFLDPTARPSMPG
jgi:hypothetical protein